ncbi:Location of vulva defective 1 [Diplonema papillatum]|nr:Location of vulva defective 1 [Diplonema papillatum]
MNMERRADMASTGSSEEESTQSADTLIRLLTNDIKKAQSKRRLRWYFVFMVVMVLNMLLVGLNVIDGSQYYRSEGSKSDLRFNSFLEITSVADWWDIVVSELPALWQADTVKSPNRPLGVLVIRQFRAIAQLDRNREKRHLPPSIAGRMRATVYRRYAEERLSNKPFVPLPAVAAQPLLDALADSNKPPWEANNNLSPGKRASADGMPLRGSLASYTVPGYAYTLYFDISTRTAAEVLKEFEALRDLHWVDTATRAVFIELVSLNEAKKSFVVSSFVLELSPDGVVLPMTVNRPFTFHNFWDPVFYFVALCDVLMLAYTVWEFVDTVRGVMRNAFEAGETWWQQVSPWNIVQVTHTIVLVILFVSRATLWHYGLQMERGEAYYEEFRSKFGYDAEGDKRILFQVFSQYADLFEAALTHFAMANVIAWVRILGLLQYDDRFGVLAGTLRASASLLKAWFVTFVFIFIPHALAGNVLYGSTLRDLRSFAACTAYFLLMIARGEIDYWTEMDEMHPFWTPVFIISYLTLTWLLMLNMFLAIIIGTFQVVSKASPSSNRWNPRVLLWSFVSFMKEYKKQLFAFLLSAREARKKRRRTRAAGVQIRKARNESVPAEDEGPDDEAFGVSEQYAAIERLREMQVVDLDERKIPLRCILLTRESCYARLGGIVPEQEVDKYYERAECEETAASSWKKVSQRWTQQTSKKVEYANVLIPAVRALETVLASLTMILLQLTDADKLCQNLVPEINRITLRVSEVLPSLARTERFLPEVMSAKQDADVVEKQQSQINVTCDTAETLVASITDMHDLLTRISSVFERRGQTLTSGIKRDLWGMTPEEYQTQVPVVLDARPGIGSIAAVEKMGRRQTLHTELKEPELPDDGFTKWLSAKVGEASVLKGRHTDMTKEIGPLQPKEG